MHKNRTIYPTQNHLDYAVEQWVALVGESERAHERYIALNARHKLNLKEGHYETKGDEARAAAYCKSGEIYYFELQDKAAQYYADNLEHAEVIDGGLARDE